MKRAAQTLTSADGHAFDLHPIDCPTCGPSPTRTLGIRGGEHHRYGQGVPTVIVQCRTCSLLFPNPFPYPRDPGALYGDPAKYFEGHDENRKIESFRELVREIKRRTHTPDPSLLDVGSGRGELLVAARREGLSHIIGLEPTPVMIEYVQTTHGITLHPLQIEQFARGSAERFACVTLSAVLEHVHNPDTMIAAAAELLVPGGVLYIDVPNEPNLVTRVGNLWNRARGSAAVYNLAPTFSPFHVFGFNPRALGMLLRKHGFVIETLTIHANPHVPARGDLPDRAKAWVATGLGHVANVTKTAGNLFAWARKRG